jgi:excisionase family DNA binding protein
MSEAETLIDSAEVARMLGFTPDYVRILARRDEIPHVRLGGKFRFYRDSVERWARGKERGGRD